MSMALKFKIQVADSRRHGYTSQPISTLIRNSSYLRCRWDSPLRWCVSCRTSHGRQVICFPHIDRESFEIVMCTLNGTLGYTGSHYSMAHIFRICSYLLLDDDYVISVLMGNRICSKLGFLLSVRLMYNSGYQQLAWYCLIRFHEINFPGTFDRLISRFPYIFDNSDMLW